MELYDLSKDIGEKTDLASRNPDVVRRIEAIMDEAVVSNPRYQVGTVYKGKAIWRKGE